MTTMKPPENESQYDIIVIGAGINGAAIAREAAVGGFQVLLVDRGDIGAGTSSTSSRLIHGGLRYLEYGELHLVYESLHERERLLKLAPHLVAPLELCIPVYRRARRPRWQVALGLALYDLLSLRKSVPSRELLGRDELLAKLPGLARDELVGGASYYDAQVSYAERLVMENVRDAVANGATLATYTRATRVRVEAGRVAGIDWRTAGGAAGGARSRLVINAAGPWVDEVLGDIKHTRLLGGTKGSHIVVPKFSGAPAVGVYVEARADGRPFFILPWNDLLLIGTTDERYEGDAAEATIDARERAYLVAETERVFPGAAGLDARVLYTHTGVRPLPYRPRGATSAITRRHVVRRHRAARGLYSIVGGKLTTHRALAEDVLHTLRGELPRAVAAGTRRRPLPGALDAPERDTLLAEIGARFGARQARRLWHVYGGNAAAVARLAESRELAEPVVGGELLAAELVYALESEWAVTLADVLQRRSMAGLAADFGLGVAADAANALVRLGLWDSPRAAEEVRAYRSFAARHGALGHGGR